MRRFVLPAILLISGALIAIQPAVGAPPASGLAPGARNRVTGALCNPAQSIPASQDGVPSAKKLGELPPGNVVLTVVRDVDGCVAPVIVRQGLSGTGGPVKAKGKSRIFPARRR